MIRSQATTTVTNSSNSNFIYSFRPIYYFNRVYGLMPFTIIYNADGTANRCEIRTFDMFWFIAAVVLNVIFSIMPRKDTHYLQDPKTTSNILTGGDYFLESFAMIFNVILIAMDMFFRLNLVKILKKINTFDEEVHANY